MPYDGVVKELMYEVDDVATKGKPLMMIAVEEGGESHGTKTVSQSLPSSTLCDTFIEGSSVDAPPTEPSAEVVDVLATPAVRRIANELSVNLNEVMMMS